METILSLLAITLVVWVLGGAIFWKAWRSIQSGQAFTKSMSFSRQHNPGVFWLVIGLYVCGGGSFICWGFLMLGMAGLSAVELLAR